MAVAKLVWLRAWARTQHFAQCGLATEEQHHVRLARGVVQIIARRRPGAEHSTQAAARVRHDHWQAPPGLHLRIVQLKRRQQVFSIRASGHEHARVAQRADRGGAARAAQRRDAGPAALGGIVDLTLLQHGAVEATGNHQHRRPELRPQARPQPATRRRRRRALSSASACGSRTAEAGALATMAEVDATRRYAVAACRFRRGRRQLSLCEHIETVIRKIDGLERLVFLQCLFPFCDLSTHARSSGRHAL
jgi:hypothetical protein